MRESFSGTALFMIVVFFVVLFTGYLCLSINQTRAFNVKNAIIRIIERHGVGVHSAEDLEDKFKDDIAKELNSVGYRTPGECNRRFGSSSDDGEWVGFNQEGEVDSDDAVFCVKYVATGDPDSTNPTQRLHYFKVKTFYHFDVPVLRLVLNLFVDGDTKAML